MLRKASAPRFPNEAAAAAAIEEERRQRRRMPGERKEFHFKLFKTPKEVTDAIVIIATKKAALRLDALIVLAFSCGVWLSLAGLASLMVTGGLPSVDSGIRKLINGLTYSLGLMIIFAAGGELFTGNTATFCLGLLSKKVTLFAAARNLILVWIFNFIGALATAYFLAYLTGSVAEDPYLSYLRAATVAKINNGWGVQILRGVGANMFVVLAIFAGIGCEDFVSKIFVCLMFISAFVFIRYEHCVANMFTLPLGLMYGADSDIGSMFWKNLIPVTIGNMIGGVLIALFYWYVYSFSLRPIDYRPKHELVSRFLLGEACPTRPSDAASKALSAFAREKDVSRRQEGEKTGVEFGDLDL